MNCESCGCTTLRLQLLADCALLCQQLGRRGMKICSSQLQVLPII
jgi:hypothetical protein